MLMSWIETARITTKAIKERREETLIVQEAEALAQTIDCEKSELSEKRSVHIKEATRLYQERGWIQIFSGYLKQSIYLVKNKATRVPDPSIPRYTKEETEALRGLSLDEIKTLHEAKQLFKGTINVGEK
tara:strand:+ start:123 stop:509 length:387 start_codon:yes stop_codon:yes gene_type:complete